MSAASRRKGADGEREVCALLRLHGWTDARRTLQSGAQGGGDIEGGPRDIIIEAKRRARGGHLDLAGALGQAHDACTTGQTPMVLHRRDGEEWLATCPAAFLLELLAEREGIRKLAPVPADPQAPLFDLAASAPYDTHAGGSWA